MQLQNIINHEVSDLIRQWQLFGLRKTVNNVTRLNLCAVNTYKIILFLHLNEGLMFDEREENWHRNWQWWPFSLRNAKGIKTLK